MYTARGDLVFIDVEDNGKGISPDRLEEIRDAMENGNGLKQEQGGIGLCNVHHRLQIYFGGRSGLSLYSMQNHNRPKRWEQKSRAVLLCRRSNS